MGNAFTIHVLKVGILLATLARVEGWLPVRRTLSVGAPYQRVLSRPRSTSLRLGGSEVSLEPLNPPDSAVESGDTLVAVPDHAQSAAITTKDPAVLVVAGPGAGKTRVLSARLAYLLMQGVSSSEILVLSFTASAANNLCAKASSMLTRHDPGTVATTEGVYCDTFHGFCSTMIRNSKNSKNLIVADDEDQTRIMLTLLESKGLAGGRSRATEILRQIRYWKELGLGYLGLRPNNLWKDAELLAYELYPEYQARLKILSALDFGDLLLHTLRLFRTDARQLESFRSSIKHVLVDEFQDVSPAQYDILRMLVLGPNSFGPMTIHSGDSLAADGGTAELDPGLGMAIDEQSMTKANHLLLREDKSTFASSPVPNRVDLFCAGDDDQSIYAWRGAQVELMRRFRFDFPGAKMLRFGVSYRLPDELCQVTTKLVTPLDRRILKTLVGHGQLLPSAQLLKGQERQSHLVLGKEAGGAKTEALGPQSSNFISSVDERTAGAVGATASLATAASGSSSQSSASTRPGGASQGTEFDDVDGVSSILKRSPAVVEVRHMADETQEIDWLVQYIKQTRTWGSYAPSVPQRAPSTTIPVSAAGRQQIKSIAILARSIADVRRISESLTAANIPFRSRGTWVLPVGGIGPLSILRLVATPDDDLAFETALDNDIISSSVSSEEMGRLVLPEIRLAARNKGTGLLQATRECVLTSKLKGVHRKTMERFLSKFEGWRKESQRFYSKGETARAIIHSILRGAYSSRFETDDSIARAIDELSRSASSFDSLQSFFSAIRTQGGPDEVDVSSSSSASAPVAATNTDTATSQQDDTDVASLWESAITPYVAENAATAAASAVGSVEVWVMTMHAAKGLEFDHVLLPFWTENNFARMAEGVSSDDRRMAFVSMTRSRKKVLISYASSKSGASVHGEVGPSYGSGTLQQQQQQRRRQQQQQQQQQPSRIVLELLELNKGLVHFEDVAVLKRLQKQNQPLTAQTLSREEAVFPSLTVGAMDAFLRDTGAQAGGAGLTEVDSAAVPVGVVAMESEEDASTLQGKAKGDGKTKAKGKSKSRLPDTFSVSPASPLVGAARATQPSADAGKAAVGKAPSPRKRATAPTPQLPSADALTPHEINRLVFDSRFRATDLKVLFKVALADLGVTRGTIPLAKGETKALSRCTALEMGTHLSLLLQQRFTPRQ